MNIKVNNWIVVLLIALVAHIGSYLLSIPLLGFIFSNRTFHGLWGLVISYISFWVPGFIVYGFGGYITAKVVKSNSIIWAALMGLIGVIIFYNTNTYFLNETSSILDIFYAYFGYTIPLIGSVLGGFVAIWRTKRLTNQCT